MAEPQLGVALEQWLLPLALPSAPALALLQEQQAVPGRASQ